MAEYNPKEIEAKWQKKWLEEKVFAAHDDSAKPKYYQLETFPYPSGAGLHVGHPKGYIAEDIHARFMRMGGKESKPREVLYTMGWDAFGLPTENYAIKVGKSPKEVTKENTDNFRRQVRMFGLSYDWDREINTSSPEYYKWTQWLFLQLFKKGLAYRAASKVNWCPKDQTVLANEQVINGKCERCGSEIEERDMEQWFLKITNYADQLLADLKGLDWPAPTVKRQEDWIGKSVGSEIDFPLDLDYRYILLHGYDGSPEKNFFPWLRRELTRKGFSFVAPQLPNPQNPTEEEQVNYVLRNFQFDERTVLFGHSLGAVVALKVLEKLERPIAGVVLAAGFLEPKFKDGWKAPFTDTFKWEFDFEKIRKNIGFVSILSDLNDDGVPVEQGKLLHEKLDGRLIETIAQKPHFDADEEPDILQTLLPIVTVFTTRPDTIFGATYLVLAPEHNSIKSIWPKIVNQKDITAYIEATSHKTDRMRQEDVREKTGVEIKGVMAVNPANGEKIPIYIADYVLATYGTGAIMAVPAHDERDFEFAKKFKLSIKLVVAPDAPMPPEMKAAYVGKGKLVNSGKFTGMDSEGAQWEIAKFIGGRGKQQYRLRDWSVSRQRYWGVPIPMIYCKKDGIVPVPENELPVILPDIADFRPQGMPPLAASPEFMNVKCPQCGGDAKRDPETLDTFVDSSWYYARYTDPKNASAIFDKEKAAHWLPTDLYVIGAEHTVLHLLYARFITKFLHDEGLLNFNEPFLKLRHQGLIRGTDGQKMSKSKGNVVNPDEIVGEFGADTVRMYEMFMGPFEDGAPWEPKSILGIERFLKRFWKYVDAGIAKSPAQAESEKIAKVVLHKTIKKVGEDIESFKFNTAISALMILLNELEKTSSLAADDMKSLLKIIHPFAPHMAQELWSLAGGTTYLDFETWPAYDASLIKDERIKLVFQVNGKTRDMAEVDAGITEAVAKEMALANDKIKKIVGDATPKNMIYVDKKLVNIVI
jgi:leucyl-tRNA synthetase